MKQVKTNFSSLGRNIRGIYSYPDKNQGTIVLLLHGLTNSMKYCPLISKSAVTFQNHNLATFQFDYFGSGLSEGLFKNKTFRILQKNTKDALDYVVSELGYKKVGLWGRSLGAILASTICDSKNIFASILISSTAQTKLSFRNFFPKGQAFSLPIKGTGKIKGEPVLPYKFYEETFWLDNLQRQHLSKATNVLVFQGDKDNTIHDITWTKEVYNLIGGRKKLEIVEGADHSYKGFEVRVINSGLKWFLKYK